MARKCVASNSSFVRSKLREIRNSEHSVAIVASKRHYGRETGDKVPPEIIRHFETLGLPLSRDPNSSPSIPDRITDPPRVRQHSREIPAPKHPARGLWRYTTMYTRDRPLRGSTSSLTESKLHLRVLVVVVKSV